MSEPVSPVTPLNPERLLTTLARHGVDFVLIGALAARLHGFPRATYDADITPARDPHNLRRLVAALRELDARIYVDQIPEGLSFDCSPQMLARADIWNLIKCAKSPDLRECLRPHDYAGGLKYWVFEPKQTASADSALRR